MKPRNDNPDSAEEEGQVLVDVENRKIFLLGEINDNRAANFVMAFQNLDSRDGPIIVILNSPGGMIHAGYAIYDVICLSSNLVTIECYGSVYSMATLILQAGDMRLIGPQCRLMIHDIFTDAQGELTVVGAGRLAKELVNDNKHYQDIIAQRTGLSARKLANMCKKETYMSAEEGLRLGFVDKVMTPTKSPRKMGKSND